MATGKRPQVVMFYSYKGGAGRTTATANVAALLAKGGPIARNVLVMDLDFDGPGMSLVMGIPTEDGDLALGAVHPLQDYVSGKLEFAEPSQWILDVCACREREGLNGSGCNEDGRLYLMPSRIGYAGKFQIRKQETDRLQNLLLLLAENPDLALDYIILDGASGVSDAATMGLSMADLIFSLMRLSYQHVSGSISMAGYLQLTTDRKENADFFPVAMVVPDTLDEAEEEYKEFYLGLMERGFGRTPLWVSEIHTLKWEERILLFEDDKRTRDQQRAYQPLVDTILNFNK